MVKNPSLVVGTYLSPCLQAAGLGPGKMLTTQPLGL